MICIKRILKWICQFTFYFSHFLFGYKSIKILKRYLYSCYISCNFSQIGSSPSFFSPQYIRGGKYIQIGHHFVAGHMFRIEAWDYYKGISYFPQIIIGNNVCFNNNCHIGVINRIVIGDNVLVGSNVLITDHSHGRTKSIDLSVPMQERLLYSKGEVIIEENVWIGESVCILPGVKIGHNSVIGANSVITRSIPPYSVVGGNPARILNNLK